MSGQTLTALIHGEAGAGKSWLGDTAPAPRLILDAEGRAKYLPSQPKALWDVHHEHPPQLTDWETCVAVVPDFETLDFTYRWLQSGQHPFRSVVVDSLMECQKRLIDSVAGTDALQQQDWGVVLRKLEKLVRDYRDLVLAPSNPVECVIFTVGSRPGEGGKMRPMLQGQMAVVLPYFVDVVGYLYTTQSPDDPTGISRSMLVQPMPAAVAKDGTGRLPGPAIPNPNLGQLFSLLNGVPAAAAAVPVDSSQPPGGITT